jgi:predicted CopG family antitoxin
MMYLPRCKYYSLNKRHTISVNYDVYARLRNEGKFGESFSSVVSRLLDFAENSTKKNSKVGAQN